MNTELSNEKIVEYVKKNKMTVVCGVAVAACVLAIIFVIVPQVNAYFSTKKQIDDLFVKAQDLQNKAKAIESTDPEILKRDLVTVATILPDDPDIVSAMVAIQELALKSNLKIEAINFLTNLTAQAKGNSFGLEIRVSGPLINLRAFLINLGTLPRIAEVESITMQKKDSSIEATIPIQVYYRKTASASATQTEIDLTGEQKRLLTELSKLVPDNIETLPIAIDTSTIQLGKPDPFE